VIDCWATWCGPCRDSIPHVTELQHKYAAKNVIVIGMNVYENDPQAVEAFVKKMGDKMDYCVALDTVSGKADHGKTADDYMEAAKQTGIPCVFIVDGQGKLAWIGGPEEADEILEQILAGKFDGKKEAAIHELKHAFDEARDAGKWDEAMAALNKWKQIAPEEVLEVEAQHYFLLVRKKDLSGAAKVAREQMAVAKDAEAGKMLNGLAWATLTMEGVEKRDTDLALELATKAAELTDRKNAAVLDTLAMAQFVKGKTAEAVATQKQAIELATEGEKAELRERLRDYEEAMKK
jgi:thiol-disulfide isomerase/thioredoxin